jgi:PKD repeat protein
VLSHYQFEKTKLRTKFTDDSRSTNQVSKWLWNFGDGETSSEQSPHHTYATSGNYSVKLTAEDSKGYKDDFTRSVSVTDQYCRITTGLDPENDIGQVVINGTDLGFQTDKSDYRTLSPIALIDPNKRILNLNITGANNDAVAKTTKWTVWLDINDDGFFTNSDEIIRFEEIAENTPYGWTTSIDLTTFIDEANIEAADVERFIRVVGEHSYSTACSSAAGEAFDVRIAW